MGDVTSARDKSMTLQPFGRGFFGEKEFIYQGSDKSPSGSIYLPGPPKDPLFLPLYPFFWGSKAEKKNRSFGGPGP